VGATSGVTRSPSLRVGGRNSRGDDCGEICTDLAVAWEAGSIRDYICPIPSLHRASWKVLVARGGRIDHCSSRNSSPNTNLCRARRAEGNIVLIKVRMPLPRSRYPSLRVALMDWNLEQQGTGFSSPTRDTAE
jgi:hypothetical protein